MANTNELWAPSLSSLNAILLSHISSGNALFSPVLTPVIEMPHLANINQMFEASMTEVGVVVIPFIPSTLEMFGPSFNLNVELPFLQNTNQMFTIRLLSISSLSIVEQKFRIAGVRAEEFRTPRVIMEELRIL
jgi:hypothetical protein